MLIDGKLINPLQIQSAELCKNGSMEEPELRLIFSNVNLVLYPDNPEQVLRELDSQITAFMTKGKN
jgi:hypothetical protein